jgi:hypothetical protein
MLIEALASREPVALRPEGRPPLGAGVGGDDAGELPADLAVEATPPPFEFIEASNVRGGG